MSLIKAPPQVQTKVDLNGPVDHQLAVSAEYLASQLKGDPGNKLGPQAAKLATTRTNLVALLAKGVTIQADATANRADTLGAISDHHAATVDYARAAARFAGNDPLLLAALSVTRAKKKAKKGETNVVGAPTKLAILFGSVFGEALLKCSRVLYAGSYVFEYKLEPSKPEDPWLPEGGIQTKHVEVTIPGFAPSQLLRARVRAIGGVSSPWSAEVVGRAR